MKTASARDPQFPCSSRLVSGLDLARQLSYSSAARWILVCTAAFWTFSSVLSSTRGDGTQLQAPLLSHRSANDPQSRCTSRDTTCGFEGNSDIYGLGIRVGLYLQLIVCLVANHLRIMDREGIIATFYIFSFALYVAMLVLTFGSGCTYLVEIIVSLSILLIAVGIVTLDFLATQYETPRPSTSKIPARSLLMSSFGLLGGITIYGSWFWVTLATGSYANFAPTPCETSFFLYAKVTEGHFLPASVYWSFVYISSTVLGSLLPFVVMLDSKIAAPPPQAIDPSSQTWFAMLKYRYLSFLSGLDPKFKWKYASGPLEGIHLWFMAAIGSFCVAFGLLNIELPLVWNNVSGINTVSSTGQLIPFIIGLVGVVQIGWAIFKRYNHEHVFVHSEEEMQPIHQFPAPMQDAEGHWR